MLVKSFYIGHPPAPIGTRLFLVDQILQTVTNVLQIDRSDIRDLFAGFAADGAYIRNLVIFKAFAELLELPHNFTKDACLWDLAHRLELAAEDVKKDSTWLNEFDSSIQSIMIMLREPAARSLLQQIALDIDVPFREFQLFSETRFVEYVHRSYQSILSMFPTIYNHFQIHASKDEPSSLVYQKLHLPRIQSPSFLLNLLFMSEISQRLNQCSKLLQRDDVMPWRGKDAIDDLYRNLTETETILR